MLEKELGHCNGVKAAATESSSSEDVITETTRLLFEDAKMKIKELPVFDTDTFMRI